MSRLARRRLGKFKKRGESHVFKYFCFIFIQKRSLNVHKSIEWAVDIFRVAFILLFLLESFLLAAQICDKGRRNLKMRKKARKFEIKKKSSHWKELTVWNMVTILNSLFNNKIKTWKYFAFFLLNMENVKKKEEETFLCVRDKLRQECTNEKLCYANLKKCSLYTHRMVIENFFLT